MIERIGISLEADLLKQFDRLIEQKGYVNRSEAVRDLIRRALLWHGLSVLHVQNITDVGHMRADAAGRVFLLQGSGRGGCVLRVVPGTFAHTKEVTG